MFAILISILVASYFFAGAAAIPLRNHASAVDLTVDEGLLQQRHAAEAWHPHLPKLLGLPRSHSAAKTNSTKHLAIQEPRHESMVAVEPSTDGTKAVPLHALLGFVVVAILMFTVITYYAGHEGTGRASVRTYAGDAISGRSCLFLPAPAIEPRKPGTLPDVRTSQSLRSSPDLRAITQTQLLIDLDGIRQGTWPLTFTELNGNVAMFASFVQRDKPSIDIFAAEDPSAPCVTINSDLELFDRHRMQLAKLQPVGSFSGRYVVAFGRKDQANLFIRQAQRGVLVISESFEEGSYPPLATSAPVWYFKESLEIALSPRAQSMKTTILAAFLGITVFKIFRGNGIS